MSSRIRPKPSQEIPSVSAQKFRTTAIEDLMKKISVAVIEKKLPFSQQQCDGMLRHMDFMVTGKRFSQDTIQGTCNTFLSLGLSKNWIEAYACFSGYSITWNNQVIADLSEISL